MLSFFGFGRRRRRVSKRKVVHRKGKRVSMRKLPAKLIKLAKRYHVKISTKRGTKRVMKSVATLKKSIAKRIRSLIKKTRGKAPARRVVHRRRRRSARFGSTCGKPMQFGSKISFGGQEAYGKHAEFGRKHKAPRKVSKAKAMAAFRKFYKQHCRANVRHSRFGNGGNPMLSMTMGSEFCSGGGGVLGANSTGLFPSPCMSGADAGAMAGADAGVMADATGSAFGKRRRRMSRKAMEEEEMEFGKRRRRMSRMSKVGTSSAFGKRRRRSGFGRIFNYRASAPCPAGKIKRSNGTCAFGKRRRRKAPTRKRRSTRRMSRMSKVGTGAAFGRRRRRVSKRKAPARKRRSTRRVSRMSKVGTGAAFGRRRRRVTRRISRRKPVHRRRRRSTRVGVTSMY